MKKYKPFKNSSTLHANAGYTIVEFMVAMAVFLSAVAIIFGTFTNTIRANRDVNDLIIVNTDAGIITEMLTREMRTGYNFNVSGTGECSVGGSAVSFERESGMPGSGAVLNISYSKGVANGVGVLTRCESGNCNSVNSTRTNLDRLCFIETREAIEHPWRITAVFSLEPFSGRMSPVNFQTTITSRVIPDDLPEN